MYENIVSKFYTFLAYFREVFDQEEQYKNMKRVSELNFYFKMEKNPAKLSERMAFNRFSTDEKKYLFSYMRIFSKFDTDQIRGILN